MKKPKPLPLSKLFSVLSTLFSELTQISHFFAIIAQSQNKMHLALTNYQTLVFFAQCTIFSLQLSKNEKKNSTKILKF